MTLYKNVNYVPSKITILYGTGLKDIDPPKEEVCRMNDAISFCEKLELNIKHCSRLNVLEKLIPSKMSLSRFALCQYRFHIDLILFFQSFRTYHGASFYDRACTTLRRAFVA